MHNQFYSLRFFVVSFMLSIGIGNTLTAQTVDLQREDYTTGGDGTQTSKGDWMHYTIIVTNNTSSNISSSTVYGKIPAGTAYVPGTTTVNGVAVSDVSGQMPYRSGGLINSPAWTAGVVASNTSVRVEYTVQVNANTGTISNSATLQGVNSSGATIAVTSQTVTTTFQQTDLWCNQIFESTSTQPSQGGTTTYPYRIIKSVNTTDGSVNSTFFSGVTGPCFDAITGASLPVGSVLTDAEAMALAPRELGSPRLYFVNGPTNSPAQDLCYIDYVGGTTAAYRFTNHPLETNTGTGYNVTRMTFNGDGYGYALTANALDLIQFSVNYSTNTPTITPLGALINDPANGANDVLSETGGDMFGDASGNLYLIPVSGKIYRITPATRIATYLAAISGLPASGTNSVAVDANGYIYVGGAYQAIYRASFTNLAAVKISSGTVGTWKNGDFTSCIYPIEAPVLSMTKTWADVSGNPPAPIVFSGDPVEYTITVTNSGNIGAAPVKLSDAIPTYAHYIPGTTTMNGVAVPDIGGAMPFAAGSQYINSAAAATGIVMPGDANKVVIKFRVTTDKFRTVCNQAVLTFTDFDGIITTLNSDDPSKAGVQDQTCFWSDAALCPDCRTATSGTPSNNEQLNLGASVKVQPNPFIKDLNVQVQLNTAEQVKVRLIDFYGRTVYTATQNLGAGYNSLHIDVPAGLASGIYVLELSAGNNRLVQKKLIKQ